MSTSASTCYFCIRKIVRNKKTGRSDDRCVGVVELGVLTEQQAAPAFKAAVCPLIEIINMTPEEGWSIIAEDLRSLQVLECKFEETGRSEVTEYTLRFEHEVDAPTAIHWSSKSDSFLKHHYDTAHRQFGLEEIGRPKNETILVGAVCAANRVREKFRPDGYLIASSAASVSTKKGGEYLGLLESYWTCIQRYFDRFEFYADERIAENQGDWLSYFSSICKRGKSSRQVHGRLQRGVCESP